MTEIELERTYLAKFLPEGLLACLKKEIKDIYIPESEVHPVLRVRQRGDKYEITIALTKEEFLALEQVAGKKVRKIRHYYNYNGVQAEVDVFQDDLAGLVLVDFEFKEVADKNNFELPDFCLVDVTQDKTFAGGMICGKKYSDIEAHLSKLGYKKLSRCT
jgi:hypothetical protein